MYDKDEERRRRELEALKAKEAKLREELASLNKEKQTAKSRLLSTTRHENWHVRRLASLDMLMGYVGEMASARIYVRSLSLDDYVAALRPFAVLMPGADNLSIEIAAVKANYDEWHRLGEEIVLERERTAAAADHASWVEWRAKNPEQNDWRGKPMTRRQYFLVSRTADYLGIRMPGQMTRGEACDWLESHGGNLRLADAGDGTLAVPPGSVGGGGESASAVGTIDSAILAASDEILQDRAVADDCVADPDATDDPIDVHGSDNADHGTDCSIDNNDGTEPVR